MKTKSKQKIKFRLTYINISAIMYVLKYNKEGENEKYFKNYSNNFCNFVNGGGLPALAKEVPKPDGVVKYDYLKEDLNDGNQVKHKDVQRVTYIYLTKERFDAYLKEKADVDDPNTILGYASELQKSLFPDGFVIKNWSGRRGPQNVLLRYESGVVTLPNGRRQIEFSTINIVLRVDTPEQPQGDPSPEKPPVNNENKPETPAQIKNEKPKNQGLKAPDTGSNKFDAKNIFEIFAVLVISSAIVFSILAIKSKRFVKIQK